MKSLSMCSVCKVGYTPIYDQFRRVATFPFSDEFLKKCTVCGTLWHENFNAVKSVSVEEAQKLYPEVRLEDIQ